MLYGKERRSQQQNPLAFGEITKIITAEWNSMPAEQKKKYEDMAIQDKARYQEEMRVQNQWKNN